MCGIAGFMLPGRNPRYRELESRLHAMIAMLRHRGPDDAGAWTDGRAGLAHARANEKRLGRPATAAAHSAEIRKVHRAGISKSGIARRLNIGRTSVRRILA